MALFLISSSFIALLAIFHNRYGTTSINSRLLLSSIAMFCWMFPVSLLRDLIPIEMAEAIELRIHESIIILSSNSSEATTANYSFGLIDGFIFLSLIGFLSAVTRIFRHQKWIQSLDLVEGEIPKMVYQGLPVFASKQVKNALLVGYHKPFIVVNSKLIDSKYIDIILEHERVHAIKRDNYWLFLIEFVRSIYWWNPLVKTLADDLCELLEARCDRDASQSFKSDIYLQKLTSLMLLNRVDLNASFNSTVVSKNPDVCRIKYLEDNPAMKIFSKINLTFLLVLIFMALLTPVTSFKSLAEDISLSETNNKLLAIDIPKVPMAGGSNIDDKDEVGVLLELELEKSNHSGLEKNTKSKKVSIWSHFGVPFSIEFDKQEIVFEVKDKGENALISSQIYGASSDSSKKLIGNPRIFTRYGNQAMIQIGDDIEMWTLKVDPIKTKNKGIKF